jgi:hypothetical protein
MQERPITPSEMLLTGGGDFCSMFPCSMFHAAVIMTHSLLARQAYAHDYLVYDDIHRRSAFILNIGERISQFPQDHFNPASKLHITYPLEVVSHFAMDDNQRAHADILLRQVQ